MTVVDRVSRQLSGCPLAAHDEKLFATFVSDYADTVKLAVEEAVARTDRRITPRLVALARRVGEQDGVPQDLIAIHLSALAALIGNKPNSLGRAYVRHSRLLLVKLVGELALYYRDRAARAGNNVLTVSRER